MDKIADLLHVDIVKFKDIFNIMGKLEQDGEIREISSLFHRILKNESKFTLDELAKIQKERGEKINLSKQYEGNISLFKSNFQLIAQLLIENVFKIVVNETQQTLSDSNADDETEAQTSYEASSTKGKVTNATNAQEKPSTPVPKLSMKNLDKEASKSAKKSTRRDTNASQNSKASSTLHNIITGGNSSRGSQQAQSPRSGTKIETTAKSQASPNMSKRLSGQVSSTKLSINTSQVGVNSEFNHVHGPASFSQTERKLIDINMNGPGPAYYDAEKANASTLRRSVSPTIGKASKQSWISSLSNNCSPGPGGLYPSHHFVSK